MFAEKILVEGNAFPGLFARSSDSLTITGFIQEKFKLALERVLQTKIISIGLAGSNLAGIYCALNSKGIVVPHFALASEVRALKSLGLNVLVLKGRFTAIGNNVVANDSGAVANPFMSREEVEQVSDALGVEVVQRPIAGHTTVGSACVATNKGFLAHRDAGEEELEELGKIFKVRGGIGTCNMGVPYTRISLVANSKGFVYGERTSGFELSRIVESLGFLD